MPKLQATLPHRYGAKVNIAGLGKVEFDAETGQADIDEHLLEVAQEAAALQGAGFVVLTDDTAEGAAPKTRAQVKEQLSKTPYPSLQAKCRTAKFPETEWMHLRGQATLSKYVTEKILALMPEDDSLDANGNPTAAPQA